MVVAFQLFELVAAVLAEYFSIFKFVTCEGVTPTKFIVLLFKFCWQHSVDVAELTLYYHEALEEALVLDGFSQGH